VRSRILASILAIAAVGLTVAGATAYLLQRDRHLSSVDEQLEARVEAARFVLTGEGAGEAGENSAVAEGVAPSFTDTAEAVEAVLARVLPGRFESSLGIVDGRPTFVPNAAVPFHLEDDPVLIERVLREVEDGSVRMGTAVSPLGNLRYIAAPIEVGTGSSGVFLTAFDLDAELSELGETFSTYTLVAAATLVAIGLVGWYVAGRLLQPIRTLRTTASRITAQDLSERIPVTGHDDVSELTTTVNGMLERLEESLLAQRRLLDDVRHELKTPITIVRGHLELLDPADQTDVAATKSLAIDELDRMSGLVDDIEALAATAQTELARVPTDVADLTSDVFAKASAIPGPAWSLAGAPEAIVAIDPSRITQAWLQLADNAAKYCPPGTRVEVGSTQREGNIEFWISDAGPGVPAEARQRIFERFGRADTGRGIRGSGLGLAIVSTIARAHGGTVRLDSSPAGSRFALVVPADPSQTAERATIAMEA
jgi:signal transduction histidine kinase